MTGTHDDASQVHVRAELRAHKRERILETATRLFYEGGYRATSMESIADELSATKPFIYYHFKNKYDILEEIALRVIRMARAAMTQAQEAGGAPDRVLAEMVRAYAGLVIRDQQMIAVFWREESNFTLATRERVLGEQRELSRTFMVVLERGVEAGLFEVSDPRLVALSIINLITFTYTWYRPDTHSADELAEHFVRLVSRMVRVG